VNLLDGRERVVGLRLPDAHEALDRRRLVDQAVRAARETCARERLESQRRSPRRSGRANRRTVRVNDLVGGDDAPSVARARRVAEDDVARVALEDLELARPVHLVTVVVRDVERTVGDGGDAVGRAHERMLDRLDILRRVTADLGVEDLDDRVGALGRRERAVRGRAVRVDEDGELVRVRGRAVQLDGVDPDAVGGRGEAVEADALVLARVEVEEGDVVGRDGRELCRVEVQRCWDPPFASFARRTGSARTYFRVSSPLSIPTECPEGQRRSRRAQEDSQVGEPALLVDPPSILARLEPFRRRVLGVSSRSSRLERR